jgi:ankyrin repeat protein
VNHINNLGWTALIEAVILGDGGKKHQQIVGLLLEHGADANIADNDHVTPLQHAKKLKYMEMIRMLEEAGGKNRLHMVIVMVCEESGWMEAAIVDFKVLIYSKR